MFVAATDMLGYICMRYRAYLSCSVKKLDALVSMFHTLKRRHITHWVIYEMCRTFSNNHRGLRDADKGKCNSRTSAW